MTDSMITRRKALTAMALGTAATLLPNWASSSDLNLKSSFRYCLNTSTISGKSKGILHDIEIASKAGYNGIEIWVNELK